MDYPLAMKVFQCTGEFSHPEADNFLFNTAFTFQVDCRGSGGVRGKRKGEKRTAQVSSEHQVQYEEAVLVILESIS
jgi:hypothetical protein